MHPPGPPLARPILPKDRGAMDRVIEYLVGDGPQNRWQMSGPVKRSTPKRSFSVSQTISVMFIVESKEHIMEHETHEAYLSILVADMLWSASSVSHITAWLWKKSLNILVRTETPELIWTGDSFLKRYNIFVLSYFSVPCLLSAFRCAYCYYLNPARKMRPQAPKLPEFSFEKRLRAESSTPGPVHWSASDTEERAPPSGGIYKHRPAWMLSSCFFIWAFGLNEISPDAQTLKQRANQSTARGDPLRHSHVFSTHIYPSYVCLILFLSWWQIFKFFLCLWEPTEVRRGFPV